MKVVSWLVVISAKASKIETKIRVLWYAHKTTTSVSNTTIRKLLHHGYGSDQHQEDDGEEPVRDGDQRAVQDDRGAGGDLRVQGGRCGQTNRSRNRQGCQEDEQQTQDQRTERSPAVVW